MKTFTIEQITVNRFTIRDDARPKTNYCTCTLTGMLSEATKLARAGHRLMFKIGSEERVIIAQEVAS